MKAKVRNSEQKVDKTQRHVAFVEAISRVGKSFLGNPKETPLNLIPDLLKFCPLGESHPSKSGQLYEKFVLCAMVGIFGDIVDHNLSDLHPYNESGFSDIELPFRSEMVSKYPHWLAWYLEYKIRFISVEVKNLKGSASCGAIVQLKHHIEKIGRGKFGFVVSRNGFTNRALKELKCFAQKGFLILPLENEDLVKLIKIVLNNSLNKERSLKVIQYLRVKENQLYRIR